MATRNLAKTFAVSFVAGPDQTVEHPTVDDDQHDGLTQEGLSPQDRQTTRNARRVVSKIAKLKVDREEFDQQANTLKETNVVFHETQYDAALVAKWVPDPKEPVVPDVIINAVVVVPRVEDAGMVVATGPGDATAAGEAERQDADVEAARQARYISAFDEQ